MIAAPKRYDSKKKHVGENTAQALYGKQLEVNIDRASIDTILDKYLCYYPKQFRFLLKERIETVLMEQQKKLFEK